MRLPDLVAYQAAVQHPATAFSDPELQRASVATGRLGLPRAVAGNFAVTYQLTSGGRRWAVRCFHRDAADRPRRYAAISQALGSLPAPFVPVSYLPLGVRVGSIWFPVTKMAWLDGETLNRAVERRLGTPRALLELERRVIALVAALRQHGLAHGDLQHGNILVEPSGALRLVDYDGMYVPALRGLAACESGDPNYQHPDRRLQFDADLDRFAALVIVVALRALGAAPRLWATYNSGDNLLFRRADFVAPHQSTLFGELRTLPSVRDLAVRLAAVAQDDYRRIPLLDDVLHPPAQTNGAALLPHATATQPRRTSAATPAAPAALQPLHVSVLNRLYGARRSAALRQRPSGAPSTAARSWQLRRAAAQLALAFSPDGDLLATADADGGLRVRERAGGRTRQTWRTGGPLVALAWSADGQQVVSLSESGECCVWRLGVATPLQRLRGGSASLVGLACAGHGPVVARSGAGLRVTHQQPGGTASASPAAPANWITAPSSGSVSVDLPRGRQLQLALRAVPSALALAPDGQTLAVGAHDGGLRCWSLVTGTLLGAASQLAPVTALALGADGRSLASADAHGTVHLWHLPGGRPLQTLAVQAPVMRLALAADGRRLVAATQTGRVQVWDLSSQPPRVLHDLRGPAGDLADLAWAPDGQGVAACTRDGVVWLRSLVGASATGSRPQRTPTGPPRPKRSRAAGTQRTTRRPSPAPAAGSPLAALGPGGWLRHWLRRVPSVL